MDVTSGHHHHNSRQNSNHHAYKDLKKLMPAKRLDKMTFLSKKYEEIVLLDAMQNFSSAMLPFFSIDHYPFVGGDFRSSIMGDSPTAGHREPFNFDPGRATPPPTTSFMATNQVQTIQTQPQDSTAIEPAKEEQKDLKDGKDKDKDSMEFNSPDANPGYKPETEKKPDGKKGDSKDGGGGGGGGDKEDGEKTKLNGDVFDGKWVQPVDDKKPDDEKEDSCVVNCLYFTLQCCECTIT